MTGRTSVYLLRLAADIMTSCKRLRCFCVAGASKVPARLPQQQQGGDDRHGGAAAPHQSRQRPTPGGLDPQGAEGTGARGPAEGHV